MSRILPSDNVCEMLFQMHKNDNHSVPWTRDTYKGKPKNIDEAKERLRQKGIIYSKTKGNIKTTYLNPEYFDVASYEEVKRSINTARHRPQDSSLPTGDEMALPQEAPPVGKSATRRSKTASATKSKKTKSSRSGKATSKNIFAIISVLVIVLFIGYILWRLGLV